jgi:hypothetical protein
MHSPTPFAGNGQVRLKFLTFLTHWLRFRASFYAFCTLAKIHFDPIP